MIASSYNDNIIQFKIRYEFLIHFQINFINTINTDSDQNIYNYKPDPNRIRIISILAETLQKTEHPLFTIHKLRHRNCQTIREIILYSLLTFYCPSLDQIFPAARHLSGQTWRGRNKWTVYRSWQGDSASVRKLSSRQLVDASEICHIL